MKKASTNMTSQDFGFSKNDARNIIKSSQKDFLKICITLTWGLWGRKTLLLHSVYGCNFKCKLSRFHVCSQTTANIAKFSGSEASHRRIILKCNRIPTFVWQVHSGNGKGETQTRTIQHKVQKLFFVSFFVVISWVFLNRISIFQLNDPKQYVGLTTVWHRGSFW